MSTKSLNAAIGVDFSLIGTKLHAMYKKDTNGYKILLIPTLQSGNEGITIQELIDDIKSLTESVTGSNSLNTEELTTALDGAVQEAADEEGKKGVNDKLPDTSEIRIILSMAYLYINKEDEQEKSDIEYAFNLNILTTGLIPKALSSIVTVDHIGISVWNTERTQILNQMSIVKIEDYLGLPTTEETTKKADQEKADQEKA